MTTEFTSTWGKETETIRWGIIGCGDVCEIKSGPGFQKAKGSQLVAVMRRDAEKAKDFAQRHGVPNWYANADELIQSPEVDAVYVATPPGNHRDLALAVAAAGKPCYVEKPMARNHAECQEMVEVFRAAQLPLFVAYYRRCLPRFVTVRDLLRSGRLGAVQSVHYQLTNGAYLDVDPKQLPWRFQPEQSGGGLLLDLGSHLIDLLDHLFGPLQNVDGSSRNVSGHLPVADQTELTFTTQDGALGQAHWDFASKVSTDCLRITGERGEIVLSCFGNEPFRIKDTEGEQVLERPNPAHVHQPLIQTMVSQLLQGGDGCPSTGESAARASWVMDRINQEAASSI